MCMCTVYMFTCVLCTSLHLQIVHVYMCTCVIRTSTCVLYLNDPVPSLEASVVGGGVSLHAGYVALA